MFHGDIYISVKDKNSYFFRSIISLNSFHLSKMAQQNESQFKKSSNTFARINNNIDSVRLVILNLQRNKKLVKEKF